MQVYSYGNIKHANHLDRQSADDVTYLSNMFNSLLTGLINQGKLPQSRKVANKYFEVIPDKFYTMRQVMSTYYFTENLYRMNDLNSANAMINKSAAHITKELNYLTESSETDRHLVAEQNIRFYLAYLGEMVKLTEAFKQNDISKKLEKQYNGFVSRLTPFAGS